MAFGKRDTLASYEASAGQAEGGSAGRDDTCVRRISVLGATGSIGQSTLDLVARHSERFEIDALTANSDAKSLATLAVRHKARIAVVADPKAYGELEDALLGTGIIAAAGADALAEAAARPVDCVVAAIVGAAGLVPTLAAVRQGRRVALANKECLVTAGDLFMKEVAVSGTELLPVDSEHSAAFQAIGASAPDAIEQITLTASGGPFRDWDMERLKAATPEQALRHPNWSMGAKISIDSATLMNKGLELIEAYHLFPVSAEQLSCVVHPQSIVHCLVAYRDGSVLAQMSAPDMRTPIALALSWPQRIDAPTERLDFAKLGSLSFEAPDVIRFPALALARQALQAGGGAPVVLNAANEEAVRAFLDQQIGFLDIARIVGDTLEASQGRGLMGSALSLDDIVAIDSEARVLARARIEQGGWAGD